MEQKKEEEYKPTLEQQMIEAAVDFKNQFDPKNPEYHGGITQQVPVGGARVPESMKGMYPENVTDLQAYIDAQPELTDFGPEYDATVVERQKFLAFKKALSKMQAYQESILRHQETYKAKKDGSEKDEILINNIKGEQQKLKELIQNELLELVEVLEKSEFSNRYVGIRDMIDQAEKEFKDKTELGNWFLNFKKFGQYSFNDAGNLMQRMKKLKKEALEKHAQQQQQNFNEQKKQE